MRVLVDTPIWSLVLRRRRRNLTDNERQAEYVMRELIGDGTAVLIGPVRQEVLSGIAEPSAFDTIARHLEFIDDEPVEVADYVFAARCYNMCRSAGIDGSMVDMLICSMAIRRELPIFTFDKDFQHYRPHLKLRLPTPRQLQRALDREHRAN